MGSKEEFKINLSDKEIKHINLEISEKNITIDQFIKEAILEKLTRSILDEDLNNHFIIQKNPHIVKKSENKPNINEGSNDDKKPFNSLVLKSVSGDAYQSIKEGIDNNNSNNSVN